MPITARTPLGEVKTYKVSRDENQLLDVTKEKIEGRSVITAPKDGSTGRKASISDLRRDLTRIQAKVGRKPEVPALVAVSAPNDSLEVRLQDLVLKHQSSKAKHTAEIDALKKDHATTQASYRATQKELALAKEQNQALVTNLANQQSDLKEQRIKEKEYQLKADSWKRERESLNQQLAQLRAADSEHREASALLKHERQRLLSEITTLRKGGLIETDRLRLELEQQCALLKSENGRLTNENERMVAREDKVEDMEDERDWLEYVVDFAAYQCGQNHLLRVDRKEYEHVKEELEVLRIEVKAKKVEAVVLKRELESAKESVELLTERLMKGIDNQKDLEVMVEDLLEQRRFDRDNAAYSQTNSIEDISSSPEVTAHDMAEIEARHFALSTLSAQHELCQVLLTYRHFLTRYEHLKETLSTTQEAQLALQREHKVLEDNLKHLEVTHSTCGNTIAGLNCEITRWQHAEQALSIELRHVQAELKRMTAATRGDKEALKRANEGVLRSKAAEDAFEEEIVQLREAFVNASEYEEMYNNLLEENRELLVRERLAAEEVERYAMQNAELLGHGNGDQKISYVDSLRRDMALTKHELASTRLMLNKANDRIETLAEEVEAYKSVNKDFGLGGSTRTRVVRRVPEGTWLSKSTRTNRSVSGPVSR